MLKQALCSVAVAVMGRAYYGAICVYIFIYYISKYYYYNYVTIGSCYCICQTIMKKFFYKPKVNMSNNL